MPDSKKLLLLGLLALQGACVPALKSGPPREANVDVPEDYGQGEATASPPESWHEVFQDPNLVSLIDEALGNNQELAILEQGLLIRDAQVLERRGEYLPRLGLGAGAGTEKVGRYTSQGVSDATHQVDGEELPDPLPDLHLALEASWEIDAWGRLRNGTKAAQARYLASVEGRNFAVTLLVAELSSSYYELLALDAELAVVESNVEILESALKVVRLQKEAAQVTELAVQRFEAELYQSQARRYEIRQEIVETENRVNLLCGRYPQPVTRSSGAFLGLNPTPVSTGQPGQLLELRPDVRAAELELQATKLDVKAARALFYPSLSLDAELGYEAFSLVRFGSTPESLLYGVAASLAAPLLNRNAIKAEYIAANAEQMQAVLEYERAVMRAYTEVSNQLSAIRNLDQSVSLQTQRVERLEKAIDTSLTLFASARADYLEVLTTRQELLEAQLELIESKQAQLRARVELYQALGGGWGGAT